MHGEMYNNIMIEPLGLKARLHVNLKSCAKVRCQSAPCTQPM